MADIRGILQSSLQGKYDGFSYRVAEVPYDWTENGLDVSGRFFYLTFQNGVPTLEEFVKLLHGQLVPYCIPRQIRDVKWGAMPSDNDWRHATELLRQARDLFIRAGEDGRKASEVGELILFTLLEAAFGAPQLVCKMALKTSEAMPIHGADGIHVMLGRQQGSICFVWVKQSSTRRFRRHSMPHAPRSKTLWNEPIDAHLSAARSILYEIIWIQLCTRSCSLSF